MTVATNIATSAVHMRTMRDNHLHGSDPWRTVHGQIVGLCVGVRDVFGHDADAFYDMVQSGADVDTLANWLDPTYGDDRATCPDHGVTFTKCDPLHV